MLVPHFTAFRALVDGIAGVPPTEPVARVTESGEPVRANYVLTYPPKLPGLDDERWTARQRFSSKARLRFDVRPVATDPDSVLLFTDRILSAVIGTRLVVPGRVCDPLTLVTGVEEGKTQYDRTARLYYVDFTLETVSREAS